MSFIQKLIERKTQATGSVASKHVVEEDLAAQKANMARQEPELTMVDIVDLDDPDTTVPEGDLSTGPAASQPEPLDNMLNLTDPFALSDEDEITENISDLPDLETELSEEIEAMDEISVVAGQGFEAAAIHHDIMDIDGSDAIAAGDEALNIWDIDMDGNAHAAETPVPHMHRVQAVGPVNEDSRPQQPEISMEIAKAQPQEPAEPDPATYVAAAHQTPEKRRAGRVKTRLLGFDHSSKLGVDLFDRNAAPQKIAQPSFPVGWLVVIDGPGRGEAFSLYAGMSQIGRGEDQTVSLDFGDATISRDNHAAIVYDIETHTFLLGHGGKANVVRLNGKPLICTEEVRNAALIRIGETTLRLVVLCNAEFNWEEQDSKGPDDAAIA